MRRLPFALALLLIAAGTPPAQAQWWGPGVGRPCFGFCRPWGPPGGPGWGRPAPFAPAGLGPWRFGPPRFRPGPWGWGWRPAAWRREMGWRRSMAWRRWAETAERSAAAREAEAREAASPPRFGGWVWRGGPAPARAAEPFPPPPGASPRPRPASIRPEEAVAALPAEALRPVERHPRAAVPSRVLAAAAMIRRAAPSRPAPVLSAATRVPEPPARPEEEPRSTASVPHRPRGPDADRRPIRPVVLRGQPVAPRPAAAAEPAPASLPAASPPPAPSGDVPVAPLE